MSIIDEIEEIASKSYQDGYDSDQATLDLMRIHDIITQNEHPGLDPFERLFLDTYVELARRGLIDNH